jgi:long-chain fatty acid transport protein
MAVNNVVGPDGQMSLKDRVWGFGANVGVLIKASERTRFGVTYLSAVDLDFSDKPGFTGLGAGLSVILADPRQLNLGVTVPQSAMAGVYHALSDKWAVMADFGWQDWSEFGYVQAGVEAGGSTTLDLKYQDTWHGAVGAQYRASEKWLLSGGVAFDSSAVENENRTVTLPMGQTWRFGIGAQYQLSPSLHVGAAWTFAWCGDMPVDQGADLSLRGRVSGSYDDAWLSFANLNLTWRF